MIFRHRAGICDWCSADGIDLVDYDDKQVCSRCHKDLLDRQEGRISAVNEGYRDLLDLLGRSGG